MSIGGERRCPVGTEGVFTARELAAIWGYRTKRTAYIRMDELVKSGWKFEPGRKFIVDRAGRRTTTDAYLVIPPEDNLEDEETT